MFTSIQGLQGHIKVEEVKGDSRVTLVDKKNTLVKESVKVLLSQLITPGMVTNNTQFPREDNTRPIVYGWNAGGVPYNSIGYMHFGYYEEGETVPAITVSSSDSELFQPANRQRKLKITSVTVNEYNVKLVCSFEVIASTSNYNYVEAALYTVGSNTDSGGAVVDPTDVSYDSATPIMFAHQSHTAVQASVGSTIVYTWTISIQEP